MFPFLNYGLFNNYKNEELEKIKSTAEDFYWRIGDGAMKDFIYKCLK